MTDTSNIIPLPNAASSDPSKPSGSSGLPEPYLLNRQKLTNQLLRHSLVDSFHRFNSDGKPYPFIASDQILPGLSQAWVEHRHQSTVLMFLIDGTLPRPLNKHFRLRSSNRVTWRNIQRMAPDLDLTDFKAAHCQLDDPGFGQLLPRLLALDYALLAQQAEDNSGLILSHMHVKLERLTDTAIKVLGKHLGYIERRLFERGEDYVEALEGKFFEYFGFSANAAGRKSAAAMAAQLLTEHSQRFAVFVAGQEDRRLTVLDEGPLITQYLLIRPTGLDLERFHLAASAAGVQNLDHFALAKPDDGTVPLIYRLQLERTKAAQPGNRRHRDRDLSKLWLQIREAAVLPRPGQEGPEVPYYWAEESLAE